MVNPEQAEIVRIIYSEFLKGFSFKAIAKKLPEAVSEFDEALWGSLVEYVTVGKDKTMVFTMIGGAEITA